MRKYGINTYPYEIYATAVNETTEARPENLSMQGKKATRAASTLTHARALINDPFNSGAGFVP